MKNRRSRTLVVILALLCVGGAFALGYWCRTQLVPVAASGEAQIVRIERGAGASRIARQLEAANLIRSAPAFELHLAYSGLGRKLKAGAFEVAPTMSGIEIAERIAAGQTGSRNITVPEGLRLEQIAERVADSGLATADELLAAATPESVADQVEFDLPESGLEGYLLPETYEFALDTDAQQIVARMVRELEREFVTPNAEAIAASKLNLHEIITLASLVEREARVGDERATIAGVLTNRLDIDMKLQCDATVQYALDEHKPRLTFDDLKVDSPYNTYLHKGLPPGPIAAPGLACLEAALHPAQTDALFYVAQPDGRHVFTRTYEEHLAAIRKIRGE